MPKPPVEGDTVMGWPDRRRPTPKVTRDAQGRVIMVRSPFWDLEGLITPTDLRYVWFEMQGTEPIHPDDWRLSIYGEVKQPLALNFEELRRLPDRVVRCVTECAGSEGRFFHYQKYGGEKPKRLDLDGGAGFVSSGEWVGVPLRTVLEKAGLTDKSLWVLAEGRDVGRVKPSQLFHLDLPEYEFNFAKCLPMEKALDPDTMLAWALNGEFIRHPHGGPVRLIVPGWVGNWSIKWLHKLEVLDHMAPCYFGTEKGVYIQSEDDPNRVMVTFMGVKTFITDPREEHSPLPTGSHVIRGLAYSGEGAISRVEVSVDGGEGWRDAYIQEPHQDKWLWVRWSYPWDVQKEGKYRLMARATDEKGRVQPQVPWNYQLKAFDGIVPVDLVISNNS